MKLFDKITSLFRKRNVDLPSDDSPNTESDRENAEEKESGDRQNESSESHESHESHESVNDKVKLYAKVPTVLQMEVVECGAAALAMILAYFGKYIPLEKLRIDCGVSRDGSKALNMVRAARKYGLEVKAYKREPEALKLSSCPMILHWDFNHFIVLEGFKGDDVYINDPGMGRRKITWKELDESFTGVVLTFEKTSAFQKGGEKQTVWKALARRLKGPQDAIIYIILIGLGLVLPQLVSVLFSRIFMDYVLKNNRVELLPGLFLSMGVTAAITGALSWLKGFYLSKLRTKISVSSSSKFLWHVLRLPIEFFSQRMSGDISSRVSDNDSVADVLSGQLAGAVLNFILMIFYFILMIRFDFKLSIIAVVSAVSNILYIQYIASIQKDRQAVIVKESGKFEGTQMDGLRTIETLKATGAESDFFAKWSGYQAKIFNTQQRMTAQSMLLNNIPTVVSAITSTAIFIICGLKIMDGLMTFGTMQAFNTLMEWFLEPVESLTHLFADIQIMTGEMNRLDDVMNYPEDELFEHENIEFSEDMQAQDKLEGYVEVKSMSFGYSRLEPPIIKDFNLRLRPGARVAIVGASGSGKSTVAKVISGLYKPWEGEILFDDKQRNQLPAALITNSVSMVDQDIAMFSGSIKSNLTLWDESASEFDIIRASKDALIHEDVTLRPGAYMHSMTEGGSNFSGGQIQRLEIARALVNNPSILIMDEATSALDPTTEKIVYENIKRRGCTCVIIAHRLSTIRDSDEIIVLHEGNIVQRGTHNELKDIQGYYAELIRAV